MNRYLLLLMVTLLLNGCAPMAKKEAAPPESTAVQYGNPDEVDTAALKACDGSAPVIAIAAATDHGSTEIRCITAYTNSKALTDTLQLNSVLLVLDIDDTLITSDTFFGSDRWFNWQNKSDTPTADKVTCLYDVVALNYEAGTQKAVEKETGGVEFINKQKVPKLLLTSRGATSRGGTERELLHAGYELPLNLLPNNDGISWINVKDGKAAPISYANGIQMVTGRDKGQQLLDLLGRLKLRYDNIVLIDDGEANIKSLRNALPVHGINYYGFHYKGVTKGAITDTEKDESHATWLLWSKLIEVGYKKRWARWQEKDKAGCGV